MARRRRLAAARARLVLWLQGGLEPRKLSFTLALGFAIGCIPLPGVTTAICAVLALCLGLNMPAMQAANWLAMPFQLALLVPFLRFGQWLSPGRAMLIDPRTIDFNQVAAQAAAAPLHALAQMGSLLGHALLGWLLTAMPALLLMTLLLTPVLHGVSRRMALSLE